MHLQSYKDVAVRTPRILNPYLGVTTSKVEAFCRKYQIWLPNFDDYHTMTAYLYPRTSARRLITINVLMNLLWFIDDYFEDGQGEADDSHSPDLASLFAVVANILLSGEVPNHDNKWLNVVMALRQRFVKQGGEKWLPRLVDSLHHHLQYVTLKHEETVADWQSDIENYVEFREGDSGMYVAVDCVEFAYGIDLPEEIWGDPIIQRARRDVTNVGGLINDLMSYHIDQREGSQFNLISVVQNAKDCTHEEAVHHAVAIVNSFIEDFYQCKVAMKNKTFTQITANPQVHYIVNQYMQGLEDQIAASWFWQIDTNRYKSADAEFEALRPVEDFVYKKE